MKKPSPNEKVYTPVTLIDLFADAFQLSCEHDLLWLQGVYRDRERQSYRGFYYDRLKDEQSGQTITIRLPEKIKQALISGDTYLFKGSLQKDIRFDGVIEPVFMATALERRVSGVSRLNTEALLAEAVHQKQAQGYKPVDDILLQKLRRGDAPRVAIIYGVTSIVREDVSSALGHSRTHYDIVEQRINLLSKEQIIAALTRLNDDTHDVVAIARGGGPGLEIFDDLAIIQTALMLQPVLITAIGHARDMTLIEKVADKRLTTPTALGHYLQNIAETAVGKPLLQANLTETSREQTAHQRQLALMWFMILVMALFIVFLLFVWRGS